MFVPAPSQLSAYPGAVFRAGYLIAGEEGLEMEMGSDAARAIVFEAAKQFRDRFIVPNLPTGARVASLQVRNRNMGVEVSVDRELADSQVLDAFPQRQWLTYLDRHFIFELGNAGKVQEGQVPEPEIVPAPELDQEEEEKETHNGTAPPPPTNGTPPPPDSGTTPPPPGTSAPPPTTGNGGGGGATAQPVQLQLGGAAGWAAALIALGLILARNRRS